MAVKEFCCAKLSPDMKSIFGLRMGSKVPYLLLLAASFLVISSSADTELSCANVKNIFERKGILSSVDIQEQPNSGEIDLVQTALEQLQGNVIGVPWPTIVNLWSETVKARLYTCYHEAGKVQEYLNKYPVLKGPEGWRLLIKDFEALYPASADGIAIGRELAPKIITHSKNKSSTVKDKFIAATIKKITEQCLITDAGGLCSRAGAGCCGGAARARLTGLARVQLEGALRSELAKLSDTLATRGRKFDEFFRKLLQLSREEFHAMFKRTYGMIYEQHSYVFEQLFEQLERYYARGDTDFDLMMDGFFGILYQKMFTVLNSQYSFDEKYLKCVNSHMRDIQPFEDVPSKLSVQLRRAFVATRTFHKALRAGADVVNSMMQVGLSESCVGAWARLRYCGACAGWQPPACSRYCHNVQRGCLPAHADLGDAWDSYVDAVEKVADRLLGPFNIAMVVEPIDIKISEAIMSFQEHNQEISQKIFAGCGKPVLGGGGGGGGPFGGGRGARSVADGDDFEIEASYESVLRAQRGGMRAGRGPRAALPEPLAEPVRPDDGRFRPYGVEGRRGHGGGNKRKPPGKADDGHGAEWGGPALERLVRETRARIRSSKRYWSRLPALLCSTTSVTGSPCFNGTHVASYTVGPAGEGSAAMASNPEVRTISSSGEGSSSSSSSSGEGSGGTAARAQLDTLRTLTARLKDAYNGLEVHWNDADDLRPSSSSLDFVTGEGSGSGSGDDEDDDDEDGDLPDDDEDRPTYPDGSGDFAPPSAGPRPRPPLAPAPPVESPPPPPPVSLPTPEDAEGDSFDDILARQGAAAPAAPEAPPAPTAPAPPASPPVESAAADPPSLQRALFSYAFPVVCAWFGTMVTDLF